MISYHYYILCLWKCNKSKFKPWYFCTFCQIDMVFSSTSQAADLVYLTCHERQGLRPAKGASWRISGSFKCANVWRQVGTHILYVGLTKKDGTPSKGLLNRGNIYMNLYVYTWNHMNISARRKLMIKQTSKFGSALFSFAKPYANGSMNTSEIGWCLAVNFSCALLMSSPATYFCNPYLGWGPHQDPPLHPTSTNIWSVIPSCSFCFVIKTYPLVN